MKQIKLESYKVTSRFTNGFDVDFTLQGCSTVFSGRMYKCNALGSYTLGVFMDKQFYQFSSEPFSRETQLIANQIIEQIKKGE